MRIGVDFLLCVVKDLVQEKAGILVEGQFVGFRVDPCDDIFVLAAVRKAFENYAHYVVDFVEVKLI